MKGEMKLVKKQVKIRRPDLRLCWRNTDKQVYWKFVEVFPKPAEIAFLFFAFTFYNVYSYHSAMIGIGIGKENL